MSQELVAVIKQYDDVIRHVLPKNTIDKDRIGLLWQMQAKKNPQLKACDPLSVVGSIVRGCKLGIDPERIYLIPFKKECNVIIDYRGLCDLVRRHPDVYDVYANAVKQNDEFTIHLGTQNTVSHKPANFNRGETIGYYACGKMSDGTFRVAEPMSKEEIEAHRDKFANAKSQAWRDSFDEMAKKTLLRKICKTLPQSSEVQQAFSLDDSVDVSQGNHLILDANHTPQYNHSADATTIAAINAEDRAEAEQHAIANALHQIKNIATAKKMQPADVEAKVGVGWDELQKCDLVQLNNVLERLRDV